MLALPAAKEQEAALLVERLLAAAGRRKQVALLQGDQAARKPVGLVGRPGVEGLRVGPVGLQADPVVLRCPEWTLVLLAFVRAKICTKWPQRQAPI